MSAIDSYDFIIAGSGCSGLSVAWNLLKHPNLKKKSILLLDPEPVPKNDKTWCYWNSDFTPEIVPIFKKWKTAIVSTPNKINAFPLSPYSYFCIRSEDYTEALLSYLKSQKNIAIRSEGVTSIREENKNVVVETNDNLYKAELCFKCFGQPELSKTRYPLKQHFLGWNITTDTPTFNDKTVVFMDFTVPQIEGAVFMYVLPFSKTEALFEFTFFSENVVSTEIYEREIKNYLEKYYPDLEYKINRVEKGVIPMADASHTPGSGRIIHLGTASGSPKPSTGFSFSRIQQQSKAVVDHIASGNIEGAHEAISPYRYRFYDLLLLDVIQNQPEYTVEVFEKLFTNNPPKRVFSFLDENQSLIDNIKIMASVPWTPFLKAIWRNLNHLGKI